MSEMTQTKLWSMRLTFAATVCVILFFLLLPLETTPRRWVGPDLIIGFACAWSLRRPDYVPTLLLAAMFLLTDLLLQRPPGLWAVVALVACEQLKQRARGMRDATFVSEWILVGFALAGISLAYRFGLILTLTDRPPFGLSIIELVMTVAFYPVAVAITHWILGVQKLAPGDLGGGGRLI